MEMVQSFCLLVFPLAPAAGGGAHGPAGEDGGPVAEGSKGPRTSTGSPVSGEPLAQRRPAARYEGREAGGRCTLAHCAKGVRLLQRLKMTVVRWPLKKHSVCVFVSRT